MSEQNRRRALRKSTKTPCQIVREGDNLVFAEQMTDVSEGGMLVLTDAELALGDRLMVSFQMTAMGIWVDTPATVVRKIEGRRREDLGTGFGVRFDGVDPVKRLVLRGSLRRAAPPVPKRARRASVAAPS